METSTAEKNELQNGTKLDLEKLEKVNEFLGEMHLVCLANR